MYLCIQTFTRGTYTHAQTYVHMHMFHGWKHLTDRCISLRRRLSAHSRKRGPFAGTQTIRSGRPLGIMLLLLLLLLLHLLYLGHLLITHGQTICKGDFSLSLLWGISCVLKTGRVREGSWEAFSEISKRLLLLWPVLQIAATFTGFFEVNNLMGFPF